MTTLGCHPSPFRGFLVEKGYKTLKRTGMTTLGSPGLSSQSVSGFSGRKRPKTSKRTGMTTLGSPGLSSSHSVSGFSGRKGPKNPEMDWDDNTGKPRLVIPVCFRALLAENGDKNAKWIGMTNLGNPGLSSQSVSGFSGRKGPTNLETDCDDNPGKPRLVIPVHFGVFWPKRAKKTQNGLG